MKNLFFVLAFMLIGTSFATNTVEKTSTFDIEEISSFRGTCHIVITDGDGNVVYDEKWYAPDAASCKAILKSLMEAIE